MIGRANEVVLISPGDILNQKCEQNIACCQDSGSEAVCLFFLEMQLMLMIDRAMTLLGLRCRVLRWARLSDVGLMACRMLFLTDAFTWLGFESDV